MQNYAKQARHFRYCAEEMRFAADGIAQAPRREQLLRVSQEFEKMAVQIEHRLTALAGAHET